MSTDSTIAIGALARATGAKVETIRWYEKVGLLPPPAAPETTAATARRISPG
ncbi:transcriptional regulator, MerR family [Pseudoroseomonas cervicalis ATCC 49957]|uniref:Transcriptional regulator, MerR family n=1 Tax=Pseudoroseomonas cervicalis ATCC 49957 TaxID=525371 RepID=D5RIC3_9PROT|nr:transcriptional regulator, MerR family [Pseudoroseomonas cervicalis ATCC 49957]